MTNSRKFRDAVNRAGLKYNYLAKQLDITPFGLQKKIDNMSEFKASEIHKLSKLLNLTDGERNQIFFAAICD